MTTFSLTGVMDKEGFRLLPAGGFVPEGDWQLKTFWFLGEVEIIFSVFGSPDVDDFDSKALVAFHALAAFVRHSGFTETDLNSMIYNRERKNEGGLN